MNQTIRQQRIVTLVEEQGFQSIEQLVEVFRVTPQTIRRDLNQLATQGLIERHHGGAGAVSSVENTAYQTRKMHQQKEKQRIAQGVARSIPNHSSLFINIGTTNEAIAQALLQHQGLRIITNNLHVAATLSAKDDFTVIIAGGQVRSRDGGIVGEATRDFVHQFKLDYGIIGISGIDEQGNLLDFDYQEVRIAQAIMVNSRHVFLAADHTKFGRNAMVRLGTLDQVSAWFTDEPPALALQKQMEQNQVALHLC
jgi:DeoR family glycerol-3-phosphate regulon repressor